MSEPITNASRLKEYLGGPFVDSFNQEAIKAAFTAQGAFSQCDLTGQTYRRWTHVEIRELNGEEHLWIREVNKSSGWLEFDVLDISRDGKVKEVSKVTPIGMMFVDDDRPEVEESSLSKKQEYLLVGLREVNGYVFNGESPPSLEEHVGIKIKGFLGEDYEAFQNFLPKDSSLLKLPESSSEPSSSSSSSSQSTQTEEVSSQSMDKRALIGVCALFLLIMGGAYVGYRSLSGRVQPTNFEQVGG